MVERKYINTGRRMDVELVKWTQNGENIGAVVVAVGIKVLGMDILSGRGGSGGGTKRCGGGEC